MGLLPLFWVDVALAVRQPQSSEPVIPARAHELAGCNWWNDPGLCFTTGVMEQNERGFITTLLTGAAGEHEHR